MKRDSAAISVCLGMVLIWAWVYIAHVHAQLSATLIMPTTIPAGSTVNVTIIPATQPVTPPVNPPPVTPPPTTQPVAGYASTILASQEYIALSGLPCRLGFVDSNDAWLAGMPKRPDGNISLANAINAAIAAGRAAYVSPKALNWPSLVGATWYTDFNGPQQAGKTCILFPRGQGVPASAMDQNWELGPGTAIAPDIVAGVGPNGYDDLSLPVPSLAAGFGINDNRAGHPRTSYFYVGSLEFSGSGQPYAISFTDNGGGASDHVLLTNLNIHGFTTGINMSNGYSRTYQDTNLLICRCAIHNNFATVYGVWTEGWSQVLTPDSVIANNGWDFKVAPKSGDTRNHGWYDGYTNPVLPNDPLHRWVNCTFAANCCSGIQANLGGLFDTCLVLANPIGIVVGGGYWIGVNHCMFDGDNLEFDAISSVGSVTNGVYTIKASGTPGCALAMGPFGLPPNNTGNEYGCALKLDCALSGFVNDCGFLNKPDPINSNPWLQVNTVDQAKGLVPMAGTFLISNNWVHNVTTGPPTLNFSNDICPGVTGVVGIIGTEPIWTDMTRNVSTYAKTLTATIPNVVDGPSFLAAEEANCTAPTFNPALTPLAEITWVDAGFMPAQ
jgi:hypothetical protein